MVKRSINKKEEDKYLCPWTMLVAYTNEDYVMKTLATNPDIPVRAIQDQMQKQFDVGVLVMKALGKRELQVTKWQAV
ncbi:hypothetical protein Tco_1376288 [Tanacetum coccineum]